MASFTKVLSVAILLISVWIFNKAQVQTDNIGPLQSKTAYRLANAGNEAVPGLFQMPVEKKNLRFSLLIRYPAYQN